MSRHFGPQGVVANRAVELMADTQLGSENGSPPTVVVSDITCLTDHEFAVGLGMAIPIEELPARRVSAVLEVSRMYAGAVDVWRRTWQESCLFWITELRRIVYTTDAIESISIQVIKTTKNCGRFLDNDAPMKLRYLGLLNISSRRGGFSGDRDVPLDCDMQHACRAVLNAIIVVLEYISQSRHFLTFTKSATVSRHMGPHHPVVERLRSDHRPVSEEPRERSRLAAAQGVLVSPSRSRSNSTDPAPDSNVERELAHPGGVGNQGERLLLRPLVNGAGRELV